MSRGNWNKIKKSKFFYVKSYRILASLIIASSMLSVLLCLAIIYYYFAQPVTTFYATSGITPPVQLTPLNTANYSSQALLPPDPANDDDNKVIPE